MARQLAPSRAGEILRNWQTLNASIMTLDEAGCRTLYETEAGGDARPFMLRRIKARLNKYARAREREEYERARQEYAAGKGR